MKGKIDGDEGIFGWKMGVQEMEGRFGFAVAVQAQENFFAGAEPAVMKEELYGMVSMEVKNKLFGTDSLNRVISARGSQPPELP
jgi:hypothetical protein